MLHYIASLYIDGFKSMKVGRELWILIALKLLILFGIMKLFFFPNYLKTEYENDTQRSMHVLEQLTKSDFTNNKITKN
ncbi:MAG: DUF4492 domain-containing protein [Sulfurovaceae bacterium]|nr:DUF4492 domain-containing protein [Sulfurovaceae bacterium]